MVRIRTFHDSGLTAIELLIITSVVAIIAVLTAPMISDALIPSDFKRAIEITESSVQHARVTARFYDTDVLMEIQEKDEEDRQAITLVIPRKKVNSDMNEVKVKFLLPAGVQVVSTEEIIHFLPNGDVEEPANTLTILDATQNKRRQLVLVD